MTYVFELGCWRRIQTGSSSNCVALQSNIWNQSAGIIKMKSLPDIINRQSSKIPLNYFETTMLHVKRRINKETSVLWGFCECLPGCELAGTLRWSFCVKLFWIRNLTGSVVRRNDTSTPSDAGNTHIASVFESKISTHRGHIRLANS